MMSEVRQVHLDDKRGYINVALLPPAGGCNLLCLDDAQLAILRGMVFPFVRWPTRWVAPIQGELYQTNPSALDAHVFEIDDLEDQLSGGNRMGCQDIAVAIQALADAIIASPGTGTTVVCGSGGSISKYTPLTGALDTLDAIDFIPAEDIVEPDPEGDPPAGFETWEEYYEYKCKAAHYITDQIIAQIRNLGMISLVSVGTSLATGTVVAALGVLAAVYAPATIIAIVAICVQLGLLQAAANTVLTQVADTLQARRTEIICSMYSSGSAADAVTALTNVIDDAIEAIIYYGPLAALAEPIAALSTALLTQVTELGVARSLFEVAADVIYFGESCVDCVTALLLTSQTPPYNVLEIGDAVSSGATSDVYGYQCLGSSSRYFTFTPAETDTEHTLEVQFYNTETGAVVVDYVIKVHATGTQVFNYAPPNSNGGWQEFTHTDTYTLTAGTQYRFEMQGVNNRTTWNRCIRLT